MDFTILKMVFVDLGWYWKILGAGILGIGGISLLVCIAIDAGYSVMYDGFELLGEEGKEPPKTKEERRYVLTRFYLWFLFWYLVRPLAVGFTITMVFAFVIDQLI